MSPDSETSLGRELYSLETVEFYVYRWPRATQVLPLEGSHWE